MRRDFCDFESVHPWMVLRSDLRSKAVLRSNVGRGNTRSLYSFQSQRGSHDNKCSFRYGAASKNRATNCNLSLRYSTHQFA